MISSLLAFMRLSLKSASFSGFRSPARMDSIINKPVFPSMSLIIVCTLIFINSNAFCIRLIYTEQVDSKLFLWRTMLLSVRVWLSGWKLALSKPQLCSFCIHSASLSSSFLPVTFFTCLAFTRQTLKPNSTTLLSDVKHHSNYGFYCTEQRLNLLFIQVTRLWVLFLI